MDFKDDARIDSDVIGSAGGGGGRGGRVAVGGGAGIVVLLIAVFLGIDPADLLGGSGQPAPAPTSTRADVSQCRTGADVRRDPSCRWPAYATSVNQFWDSRMKGYTKARTVPFRSSVSTACGQADSRVGPFYCPGDQRIYLDTDFLSTMFTQLGTSSSTAAEAYVLAHEYGHHAQNLLGTMDKVHASGNRSGATSPAVRLELQADCYAGAYLRWAGENPDDLVDNVTREDLRKVVEAARAVGDDHIQSQSSGGVNPDAWTHGSSSMRVHWTLRGYDSGSPRSCDTFSTDKLDG